MSRGHGRVQRELLRHIEALFADHRPELWVCVSTLSSHLGKHPESCRRAAHKLAAEGLIEVVTQPGEVLSRTGRFHKASVERWLLFARLPLGEASFDYALELQDEYRTHLEGFFDATTVTAETTRHLKWMNWYERPVVDDVHDLGVWRMDQ